MNLFHDIETAINAIGHGWTSVPKGQAIASMIVALRPSISVEIGVYAGKGLVSMALAHKFVGHGMAVGIDPYTANDAVESQINPADADFWGKCVDFAAMHRLCLETLSQFDVRDYARIVLERSDKAAAIQPIGVLRIDGNHGDPAFADAQKWVPMVSAGGFIICDDIGWAGGATNKAAEWIANHGCQKLYTLDDGWVFQKNL